MKIGPMDFNQPSTWRGVIGLAAIGGISISPALAEQIALFAATAMALIEMLRDEYRSPAKAENTAPTAPRAAITRINPATPPAEKSGAVPAGFNPDTYGERGPDQSDQLRPVPSDDDVLPTAGFGDR